MRLFDLHCDTLYRAVDEKSSLFDRGFEINIEKAKKIEKYTQLAACWIPDAIRGEDALKLFLRCVSLYERERLFDSKRKMFLSVESGAALAGNLDNVRLLKEKDVKAVTLTWNGENELGGGADTDTGLSAFGREAVGLFEENGIAVDLSHASKRLFFDVLTIAKKPVIATHSNAQAVCRHRRNLSDEQFKEIVGRGGIVGLTYHDAFLNDNPEKASSEDILRHAYHFLEIGGEDHLALGSDFDGGRLPHDMRGLEDMEKIREKFLRTFGERVTEKIFFDNAQKFFNFS